MDEKLVELRVVSGALRRAIASSISLTFFFKKALEAVRQYMGIYTIRQPRTIDPQGNQGHHRPCSSSDGSSKHQRARAPSLGG